MARKTLEKVETYIEKSRFSNVAKSCRRLFFNHLNQSSKDRGYFHVDQMYGSGSGVLIRYKGKYFLLTARHVISNNIPGDFQNESPFWITSRFQSKWNSIHDFLLPRKIWNIGTLIKKNLGAVDSSDVCLIELFPPLPYHQPDNFIDIHNADTVLTENQHFHGQLLLFSGYPFELNEFDFNQIGDFTHSTISHRYSVVGAFVKEDPWGYASFEKTAGNIQHKNVTGMSGGVVCNIQPKARKVKLAGISVSAGQNICRFIPSYVFINALLNYEKADSRIIDPADTNEVDFKIGMDIIFKYLNEFQK
ncbi:hypothetical protein [Paracidovorax avenae]|uniref:hypothetical protein n=1 Tax=Paracidovorax avenae TaxID=80867 RepID=UPI001AD83091|nr:hypothetical protein [Paracidovorax avenae]